MVCVTKVEPEDAGEEGAQTSGYTHAEIAFGQTEVVTFVRTPIVTLAKEDNMQFVLIIYHGTSPLPGSAAWKAMPEAEHKALYAEFAEINKTAGIALRLPPIAPGKATTVQMRDGQVRVKNEPHLGEGIGGAFVFDAEDIDDAISLAARIPQTRLGGAVEIRSVEQYF